MNINRPVMLAFPSLSQPKLHECACDGCWQPEGNERLGATMLSKRSAASSSELERMRDSRIVAPKLDQKRKYFVSWSLMIPRDGQWDEEPASEARSREKQKSKDAPAQLLFWTTQVSRIPVALFPRFRPARAGQSSPTELIQYQHFGGVPFNCSPTLQ